MYNDDPQRPRHTWTHMPGSHAGFTGAPAADHGPWPYTLNIEAATLQNGAFRTVLWTGRHLQLVLMSIPPGGEIGLERHPHVDQFIRIEAGTGMVLMGDRADNLAWQQPVADGWAFIVPAGWWHNLVNTGGEPLQLYTLYAPPNHPPGTVHRTQAEAEAAHD